MSTGYDPKVCSDDSPPVLDEEEASQFLSVRTGEPLDITQLYLEKRLRYQEVNGQVEPGDDPKAEREQHHDILLLDGAEDPQMVFEYIRRTTGLEAERSANLYGEEIFYRESRGLMEWGSYLLMRGWIDDFIEGEEARKRNPNT